MISLNFGLRQIRKHAAWECPCILLDGESLEVAESFFYPGDRRGARNATVESVLARIGNQ